MAHGKNSAAACDALGISRASLLGLNRNATNPTTTSGEHQAAAAVRPRTANTLSPEERRAVLNVVHSEEFVDQALATWTYYQLYLILDIFSQYGVGWMVAEREHEALAKLLIQDTYMKQRISKGQLTLHADRGCSMNSHAVAHLLSTLGVLNTRSRPSVLIDNPFSESQFKTLKYSPRFPERFESIEHAREFCRAFVNMYNTQHHRSSLCLLTPEVVHYGSEAEVLVVEGLDAALRERLARFRQRPTPPKVPTAVNINPLTRGNAVRGGFAHQAEPDDPMSHLGGAAHARGMPIDVGWTIETLVIQVPPHQN